MFIFSLPTPAGVALSVVFFAGLSVCLYVGAHRVRPFQVSEETRRVAVERNQRRSLRFERFDHAEGHLARSG